ncbi:MAG: aminopeptidase P family protein [Planctomycetes bacterium]|nr:aminopeptidase P family protein [Planctomycetota bacterium]MBL7143534.1 aminopeptidase P family protein [Phycisphaerae bacterium]
MFAADVYIERRRRLKEQIQSGLILFLGNEESPMNYPDNQYPFRQDSSFLYFFGLDCPSLAAIIDVDRDKEVIFGDDLTVDDIIWTGPQPVLSERSETAGISETAGLEILQSALEQTVQQGRDIHFLSQYRARNTLKIAELLDIPPSSVHEHVSETLIRAVVAQRSIKSEQEISEIENALDISYEMQTAAMKMSKPGIYERQIAGAMEGIVLSLGGRLSFPTIFSIHGETLHNHSHGNLMKAGDIAVNDSGAETSLGYASDITRTVPVSGKFTQRQKEIYTIVLDAQEQAIGAVKPGVEFRNIHRLACTVLASGLKGLGLIKGDIDEAVNAGAHTLFFQCGLGHMMGLDVHDMEGLGEDYVGYTDTIRRNPGFGWRSLRLAKELEAGFVITVEPGIYFIPELIKRWKAENKNSQYINYDMVKKYENFGGVRIEDDVLVTENGYRVLGKKIPKTIDEVEEMSSG